MQHHLLRSFLILVAVWASVSIALFAADPPAIKPNIIFILADDLGYGDIGVLYQNQRRSANDRSQPSHFTPNLDAMAQQGIQLPHHYCSAPVCAPSRASLLLGVHQGHANVRDNQFDKGLENNHTIATVLKDAGYATAAIGKWGLQGGPAERATEAANAGPEQWPGYPTKRGFDFYYGYVRHRDGHAHYPLEDGKQVWENDREVSADLAGCYTADLFTARAKQWITEQRVEHPQQPFMCYLAYDTPHAKIQYPAAPFPPGGGKRGGLQWLGTPGRMINTSGGKPDTWCHPDYADASWDDDHDITTPEKPWPDVYRRYASAVRRIDDCVGDILQLLKDLGIDEQTLVIFTSDNGVSMESYLTEPFSPQFFHSFGPFDGIKRDCWEGGVRVGALAHWPGFIPAGSVSTDPSAHYDWMATFAELAGVPIPARSDGESLVPTLRGVKQKRRSPIYIEYYMHGKTPNYPEFTSEHRQRQRDQMQAVRMGNIMGVRYGVISATEPFELYDVETDPEQTTNLAHNSPKFDQLEREMQRAVRVMRRPDKAAPRPYDFELLPSEQLEGTQPGLQWYSRPQKANWVPRLDKALASQSGTCPIPIAAAGGGTSSDALLFSGYVQVPEDGDYQFYLSADSGALLRIHDATVVDADFGYLPGTEVSGEIRLRGGMHPISLYYHALHGTDEPRLTLKWSSPKFTKVEVPSTAFFHAASHEK